MPDNAGYYHLAYLAASLIYVGYAIRLSMKRSKLKSQKGRAQF